MRTRSDRSSFVAVRTALRESLGEILGVSPREVVFRYGPQGKPAIDGCDGVEFNVSHSREIGVIAVAIGHRLGVDVEFVVSGSAGDGLAETLLTRRELEALRGLPRESQDDAFMSWWTRKEAYVKAIGNGLSQPLESFSVSFLPGATPQLFGADGRVPIEGWSLVRLEPPPQYIAALVVEGKGWRFVPGEADLVLQSDGRPG